MDRHWFLSWTTYGAWLPGDRRGFVSEVRDADGVKALHNTPHTPCDVDLPALQAYAASIMTGEAVRLDASQAKAVAEQLRETASHRGWRLLALAVMANHIHVVVGVPGDPDPEKLLGDFKAWATRRLNAGWGRRERWWTQSGSRRPKGTPEAVCNAVVYVRDQPHALVVWLDPASGAALARRSDDTPASGAASARRSDDTPASGAALARRSGDDTPGGLTPRRSPPHTVVNPPTESGQTGARESAEYD